MPSASSGLVCSRASWRVWRSRSGGKARSASSSCWAGTDSGTDWDLGWDTYAELEAGFAEGTGGVAMRERKRT